MSVRTSEILEQILALPASDRAELADSILASLEPTDPTLIKQWAAEAEDRVTAFKRGELGAIDAEVLFKEIDGESAK